MTGPSAPIRPVAYQRRNEAWRRYFEDWLRVLNPLTEDEKTRLEHAFSYGFERGKDDMKQAIIEAASR